MQGKGIKTDLLESPETVKLITAIIQPTKVQSVKDALNKIDVDRFTVFDAEGYGRQRGHLPTHRGVEYQTNLLRKVVVEIVVNDDFLEKTLDTLQTISRTGIEGNIGDGKIFVLPVDEAIQIGGEERGPSAV
jgi:nitrogen regulatory protein PII